MGKTLSLMLLPMLLLAACGTTAYAQGTTEGRATAPRWGRDGARIYFPICKNVDFGRDCEIFAARTQGFAR